MRPGRSPPTEPHPRRRMPPRIHCHRGRAQQGPVLLLFLNRPRSRHKGRFQDSDPAATPQRHLRMPTPWHTDPTGPGSPRFWTAPRMACRPGQMYNCQPSSRQTVLIRCALNIEMAGKLGPPPLETPGTLATRGTRGSREMQQTPVRMIQRVWRDPETSPGPIAVRQN